MRATGKRNFSEIQKSNPRRRDNSIRKKRAKQKTQASKSNVDCTYTYVTVQRERITKRTAKPEKGVNLGGVRWFSKVQPPSALSIRYMRKKIKMYIIHYTYYLLYYMRVHVKIYYYR